MAQNHNKRINEKLLNYWQKLCADKPFPLEGDINPEEIEAIWDSCYVVRIEPGESEPSFRYVYLGQSLVEAYGGTESSREICEKLAYPVNNHLIVRFKQVIESRSPLIEESEFANSQGLLIKFRTCMLPLGNQDYEEVAYIIGGMKWKAL